MSLLQKSPTKNTYIVQKRPIYSEGDYWSLLSHVHTYIYLYIYIYTHTYIIYIHMQCGVRRSHATHTNESCHTHQWVMSHTRMIHVTHTNESCHTHEWVMSHTRMSHVTHTWWKWLLLLNTLNKNVAAEWLILCFAVESLFRLNEDVFFSFKKDFYCAKESPIFWRRLLIVATPCPYIYIYIYIYIYTHTHI